MSIPLAVATETGRFRRSLRRYASGQHDACPASGYHNASEDIGDVADADREERHGDNWPHDDPRWPRSCACGYRFTDDDRWQRNDDRICRLPDGSEFTFRASFGRSAPPGAMLRIPYFDEYAQVPGESWIISLPDGGDWITTSRASGGGHWTVTGTPPVITASPSIWHNAPAGWHGWIRDGALHDA